MFLMALSRCLSEVSPENRKMIRATGVVNLIPLFNLVWMILTVLRGSRNRSIMSTTVVGSEEMVDFGKTIGLVYVISVIIGSFPVALICWIMYWLKRSPGYTKELKATGA